MKEFDVNNIALSGNNLIEASAGTGKTYSIGILTLRLLLEKDIKIEEILMVTFTNSAVAELEIRIRRFLKMALSYISSNSEIENSIKFIIDSAIEKKGKKEVERLLSNAILFLDETAIYTIHGFCQLTLSEFAFDTKQLFNSELVENQNSIIENAVNDFWRKEITILDTGIIGVLKEKLFSRELLIDFSENIFSGKKLIVRNKINRNDILEEINRFETEIKSLENVLGNRISANWEVIKNIKIHKGSKLYKSIASGQDEFKNELIAEYKKEPNSTKLENLRFLVDIIPQLITLQEAFEEYKTDVFIDFLARAEVFIKREVEYKKNRNQVLSFNDLIEKLHTGLVKEDNSVLKQNLCNKYKAVFIDEFQDTDHLQYEIFKRAFVDDCDSTVFFIGDPKQSIYAWRGADLRTYIKAQKDIGDNKFTMKNNFRSTEQLVSAMNEFFPAGHSCIPEAFGQSDPFCSKEIRYEEVTAANKDMAQLVKDDIAVTSFDIIMHSKKSNISELQSAAGMEVADLLANHYLLKDGTKTKVKPKNISILFRTKSHAKSMKDVLNEYGIPSIIVDDTKIMETEDARDLFYILYAIDKNDNSSISRALLTRFTTFSIEDIQKIDFEYYKSVFLDLQQTWTEAGVYSAILSFMNKFNVRKNLLDSDNPKGNRIYTNLMQLAEILNEKEFNSKYSPENLLDWFHKSREGLKISNEYEQRIESDEDAVQIMTVHKSKGLSFDIVVLPYFNLNMRKVKKNEPVTYLEDDGFYFSYLKTDEEIEKYNLQSEQENRRLLYVAITRAAYKCIIHYNEKRGVLENFIPNLDYNSNTISFREPMKSIDFRYAQDRDVKDKSGILKFNKPLDDFWRLTSYSALDNHSKGISIKEEKDLSEMGDYDKFVFIALKKGAQTGIILHSIFEKIDFADEKYWEKEIEKNLTNFGRDISESTIKNYMELAGNTVNAVLAPGDFSLSDVLFEKRFNELEFFFSFDKWNPREIKALFPDISINDKSIEGIMHGFIDLLFEHNGKYYILDWKSNSLGVGLDNYTKDRLEEAMTENNYHLQYIVYTVAVKRFLENRIEDFDYDKHFGGVYYLFLRGMRANTNNGVFFNKPTKELIERMEKLI